jgi:hypothetical protein
MGAAKESSMRLLFVGWVAVALLTACGSPGRSGTAVQMEEAHGDDAPAGSEPPPPGEGEGAPADEGAADPDEVD